MTETQRAPPSLVSDSDNSSDDGSYDEGPPPLKEPGVELAMNMMQRCGGTGRRDGRGRYKRTGEKGKRKAHAVYAYAHHTNKGYNVHNRPSEPAHLLAALVPLWWKTWNGFCTAYAAGLP